ncbi:hypothetical protein DUNSADRAFT_14323 [Dunaliella salina]|uniref:Uncharacterized protein n=1 Tax=Dunaliella salina TaxID=3046 RepID=A0ABQ7G7L5_DUNSA|nr:hypothetical protein DUNSADRAFT_14323 [Dunaliella salina]|eukprot:KAF5830593.1 hypothetical protein DUNSADRAFT_14323 [Dunaliella salina]
MQEHQQQQPEQLRDFHSDAQQWQQQQQHAVDKDGMWADLLHGGGPLCSWSRHSMDSYKASMQLHPSGSSPAPTVLGASAAALAQPSPLTAPPPMSATAAGFSQLGPVDEQGRPKFCQIQALFDQALWGRAVGIHSNERSSSNRRRGSAGSGEADEVTSVQGAVTCAAGSKPVGIGAESDTANALYKPFVRKGGNKSSISTSTDTSSSSNNSSSSSSSSSSGSMGGKANGGREEDKDADCDGGSGNAHEKGGSEHGKGGADRMAAGHDAHRMVALGRHPDESRGVHEGARRTDVGLGDGKGAIRGISNREKKEQRAQARGTQGQLDLGYSLKVLGPDDEETLRVLRDCSVVVGLHPDQATEEILRFVNACGNGWVQAMDRLQHCHEQQQQQQQHLQQQSQHGPPQEQERKPQNQQAHAHDEHQQQLLHDQQQHLDCQCPKDMLQGQLPSSPICTPIHNHLHSPHQQQPPATQQLEHAHQQQPPVQPKAFALVPCCVFPRLFAHRRLWVGCDNTSCDAQVQGEAGCEGKASTDHASAGPAGPSDVHNRLQNFSQGVPSQSVGTYPELVRYCLQEGGPGRAQLIRLDFAGANQVVFRK